MSTTASSNTSSFKPTHEEEWNRDMNILGVTMSLLVVKNLASLFAPRLTFLSFSKDEAQFVFLIVTLLVGATAVYAKNKQYQNQVSFIFRSAFLFWIGMGLM